MTLELLHHYHASQAVQRADDIIRAAIIAHRWSTRLMTERSWVQIPSGVGLFSLLCPLWRCITTDFPIKIHMLQQCSLRRNKLNTLSLSKKIMTLDFQNQVNYLSIWGPQVDTVIYTTAGWSAQPYSINFEDISAYSKPYWCNLEKTGHFPFQISPQFFLSCFENVASLKINPTPLQSFPQLVSLLLR